MKIKRILSAICIISLLCGLAIPSKATSVLDNKDAYMICDVNSDERIDIRDLVLMKKHLAGVKNVTSFVSADIDGNGVLDAVDAVYLRSVLLKDDDLFINNDEYWTNEYVASSSNSLISKSAPIEKTVTVLSNNYDDPTFTYTTTYDSGFTSLSISATTNGKTSVSSNGTSITDLSFNDAVIEQTTSSSGATTYAAHFGYAKNGEGNASAVVNTLKLYKNTNGSLSLFTPTPNTTYKITLDYRADAISDYSTYYYGWPNVLKLAYANNSDGTDWTYKDYNVLLNRLLYCDAVTGWTTQSVTFRTGDTVKPLCLMLQSLGPWYSAKQDLWVDNVVIQETTQDLGEDFSSKVTDSIIDEDFSNVPLGSIPSGWIRNTAYNFLWKANEATGLNYNVEVKNDGTSNYLYYFSVNGGHILTMPDVNVRNYKYSIQMRVKRRSDYRMSGTIGIATDISTDVAKSENANIFTIDLKTGLSKIFNRKYYNVDFGGIDEKANNYNFSTTSNKALPNDTTEIFTLTAYHVDGYTYYYFDDKYVGSIKGIDSLGGHKIGIYNYGVWNGADPEILSVKIDELLDMSDFYDYSERIYSEDFSNTEAGSMPSDITLLTDELWGWIGNNPMLTTRVENNLDSKSLRFTTLYRQAALLFPSFALGNYCLNVNLTLEDSDNYGSFGLVTNIDGKNGATLFTASMPGSDASGVFEAKNRVTWQHLNTKTLTVSDVLGKAIKTGDDVTLTVYHIDSVSYFYVNGKFIASVNDYYNTTTNTVGIYSCNADLLVSDIGLYRITDRKISDALSVNSAAIRFADILGKDTLGGIRFTGTLDKTSELYTDNVDGVYNPVSDTSMKIGILMADGDVLKGNKLNRCTAGVTDVVINRDIRQTDDVLTFRKGFVNMSVKKCDKTYSVRAYAEITNNGNTEVYYSKVVKYCPSKIANKMYADESTTENVKNMISKVYGNSNHFYQSSDYNLTFTLFSDFHYKDGYYKARVADLNTIMDRANASNSDFVLQAGDFCNDFRGSPELTNAFLNNAYGLKAYGVYGNHELESANNNMGYVTTKLTNNSDVVWGTPDGKIGDGTIGYYYYKAKGFRVVCTDTNYSYNTTKNVWEHNETSSYGAPSGNIKQNSLGPVQLEWLEDVLTDAANNGIPCIVASHASLNPYYVYDTSPDAQAVVDIFSRVNAINEKTVIMAISGHSHADGPTQVINNVVYFSVNTATNGYWSSTVTNHYNSSHTYIKDTYDSAGNFISSTVAPITDLLFAPNTHFFDAPLSTTVRINNLSEIVIEDCQTNWLYGIVPSGAKEHHRPNITGGTYSLD